MKYTDVIRSYLKKMGGVPGESLKGAGCRR